MSESIETKSPLPCKQCPIAIICLNKYDLSSPSYKLSKAIVKCKILNKWIDTELTDGIYYLYLLVYIIRSYFKSLKGESNE